MIRAEITQLERETWTAERGNNINNPVAETSGIIQTPNSLSLIMYSYTPYSGWLAKQVSPLLWKAQRISLHYEMMIDDATLVCAQVAETDAKITDDKGWTYDLSAQWEMSKVAPRWMFQIDNNDWTWIDTGITIPEPTTYDSQSFTIHYAIDYARQASAILAVEVDGQRYDVPDDLWWINARQENWKPMEIVTQLQQVNNGKPGGYTLRFTNVGYVLEG